VTDGDRHSASAGNGNSLTVMGLGIILAVRNTVTSRQIVPQVVFVATPLTRLRLRECAAAAAKGRRCALSSAPPPPMRGVGGGGGLPPSRLYLWDTRQRHDNSFDGLIRSCLLSFLSVWGDDGFYVDI